jgi:hypothetical protein
MPRTTMPRMSSPRAISACEATNGAAPITSGLRRGGSASLAPGGERIAARIAHLDVRDDREHAVAHLLLEAVHHREHDDEAATPSAMPSIDTPEMNEMKRFLRPARPARV